MENVNVIWLVGMLLFLAGGVCGILLYNLFIGSNYNNGRLADQLDELQREYMDYQEKVNDHFTTTAHLINKMTDTYKGINEHMAHGAESLCHDEQVKRRLSDSLLGSNTLLSGTRETFRRRNDRRSLAEQPKDYAPKTQPEEKGVLAEDFGIANRNDK